METKTQEILNRLRKIEIVMEYIKRVMPNKEMFLTTEEKVLLEQSYQNEKQNKLVSSKDFRKALEI